MLTPREMGWGVYGNFLHLLFNFPVKLKLFQSKRFILKAKETWLHDKWIRPTIVREDPGFLGLKERKRNYGHHWSTAPTPPDLLRGYCTKCFTYIIDSHFSSRWQILLVLTFQRRSSESSEISYSAQDHPAQRKWDSHPDVCPRNSPS